MKAFGLDQFSNFIFLSQEYAFNILSYVAISFINYCWLPLRFDCLESWWIGSRRIEDGFGLLSGIRVMLFCTSNARQ
jgi:hypothetical protein